MFLFIATLISPQFTLISLTYLPKQRPDFKNKYQFCGLRKCGLVFYSSSSPSNKLGGKTWTNFVQGAKVFFTYLGFKCEPATIYATISLLVFPRKARKCVLLRALKLLHSIIRGSSFSGCSWGVCQVKINPDLDKKSLTVWKIAIGRSLWIQEVSQNQTEKVISFNRKQ